MSRRAAGVSFTVAPSIWISPPDTDRGRRSCGANVDLPQPEGPTSTRNSPFRHRDVDAMQDLDRRTPGDTDDVELATFLPDPVLPAWLSTLPTRSYRRLPRAESKVKPCSNFSCLSAYRRGSRFCHRHQLLHLALTAAFGSGGGVACSVRWPAPCRRRWWWRCMAWSSSAPTSAALSCSEACAVAAGRHIHCRQRLRRRPWRCGVRRAA